MNEVKKPRKPLIFYYGIALALLMLINLFVMPQSMKALLVKTNF